MSFNLGCSQMLGTRSSPYPMGLYIWHTATCTQGVPLVSTPFFPHTLLPKKQFTQPTATEPNPDQSDISISKNTRNPRFLLSSLRRRRVSSPSPIFTFLDHVLEKDTRKGGQLVLVDPLKALMHRCRCLIHSMSFGDASMSKFILRSNCWTSRSSTRAVCGVKT